MIDHYNKQVEHVLRAADKAWLFCKMASLLKSLSCCSRAKVGCVITPLDFSRVFAIGYNGPAATLSNSSCTGVPGKCGCVHAEANALIKLTSEKPSVLFTTTSPCQQCYSMILNSRTIQGVIYGGEYRDPPEYKLPILTFAQLSQIVATRNVENPNLKTFTMMFGLDT